MGVCQRHACRHYFAMIVAHERFSYWRAVLLWALLCSASSSVASAADFAQPVSFRLDVLPVLTKAGCNRGTCHGALSGKGGFRLSLRGDDPVFDLASIVRDQHGRRISRIDPAESLILKKATGRIPHEGGRRFRAVSPEFDVLSRWIAAGAVDDVATAPQVLRLEVSPKSEIIPPPERVRKLRVVAQLSDGSQREVTQLASYEANEPSGVEVSANGLVKVDRPIEVAVSVRYAGARATSRLAFLADRPAFVWSAPTPTNAVDEAVFAKLKWLRIHPSPPADDHVVLRRAYLSALGILPTPEETNAFLADRNPDKRARLVDRLLERREFADYWAMKWADVLRNEEKAMGLKGVWTFHRWLVRQFDQDVPVDQVMRAMVASSGSTWVNPPASFYRTNRDPTVCAETVGQVFLGIRLQCAKCHNHPFDAWTQKDYYGLAAFFAGADRKQINNRRRDGLDSHEINGDEVVFFSKESRLKHPMSGAEMVPRPLGGVPVSAPDPTRRLQDLADQLARDPQFARNAANRIWYHVMGRGIVDPPDDFRESNPPSNPDLLNRLTQIFTSGGMRVKPLVATIMKSQTFQLDSTANSTNAEDETNFSKTLISPLPAEVLLDAICSVLESPEPFDGAPLGTRAVQLPGVRMSGKFTRVFGKPDRLLTCDCERTRDTSLSQALEMVNGELIRTKLEEPNNRLGRLLREGKRDSEIIEEFTLAALCRPPSPSESHAATRHVRAASNRRKALEDFVWAILNSKEFLLRQ
jgi:hypothetical protein